MPEILEGLSTIGFHLTRITNGTRITTQFVERLDRLPVAISVSLVTLDRVTYRHIAASITWRRFLEGIALSKAFFVPSDGGSGNATAWCQYPPALSIN